ncbi:hypothetical protein H4217_000292 [Coemansia sp. RSA 1939]|nr:hypothetical protein H4217_000292 [Coemansia sp. RSA 1939]KAJ2617842.1 hypothetical protein EV177_000328 [Coemansia sp. RSA 1804]KAJ2695522.1 hypothetical protein GGH99_000092 [Coemansia sp. RSA 1285]
MPMSARLAGLRRQLLQQRLAPQTRPKQHRSVWQGQAPGSRGGTSSIAILGSATPWDKKDPAPEAKKRSSVQQQQHKRKQKQQAASDGARRKALAIHREAAETKSATQQDAAAISAEPSFYSEEIDEYASRTTQRITLQRLLEMCEPPITDQKLLASAQYLSHERPVRYAKRVKLFQRLPFIVNTNPFIHDVYLKYYANFVESRNRPAVKTRRDQLDFMQMLVRHSDSLKHVMPQIARGFYETRAYFGRAERKRFLDQLITMRIGLRLLTSQHVALYNKRVAVVEKREPADAADPTDRADCDRFTGVVDSSIVLGDFVRTCAQGVQAMCDISFGEAPDFVVDGDGSADPAAFSYVPSHLEYMLTELLKNAFRASLHLRGADDASSAPAAAESSPAPVLLTVSRGNGRVAIRIRDRGGGIPRRIHARVFDYSFTTAAASGAADGDPAAQAFESAPAAQGPFAGLGFGLPMTKIYAEYFGGSLHLVSLEGYGCDAFLELPSIKPDHTPQIDI